MLAPLILGAICLMAAEPTIELESLRDIVNGLQADLKDVEFVYEGSVTMLGLGETRESPGTSFQANFATRSDRAMHFNLYSHSADKRKPVSRRVLCISLYFPGFHASGMRRYLTA